MAGEARDAGFEALRSQALALVDAQLAQLIAEGVQEGALAADRLARAIRTILTLRKSLCAEAPADQHPKPAPAEEDRTPHAGLWRVTRSDVDEQPRLTLNRLADAPAALVASADPASAWRPAPVAAPAAPPVVSLLDLPPLEGFEDDARPLVAAAGDPWRGVALSAGPSADSLTLRARVADPAVIGVLTAPLPAGPVGRWDEANAALVSIEGGALASAADEAVLNGANALVVQGPGGDWEVLQFASAEMTGPGAYRLTRLLRGQLGSEGAMGAAAGAPAAVLDPSLTRAQLSGSERMLDLAWRAAPPGASGVCVVSFDFTWSGVAWRPFSPARLFAAPRPDGGVDLSWIRRTRVQGDSWDGEDVPLGEESESYRVEILAEDGSVIRAYDAAALAATYAAADLAQDFLGGAPAALTVRVRQRSAIVGLGAPLQRTLCL